MADIRREATPEIPMIIGDYWRLSAIIGDYRRLVYSISGRGSGRMLYAHTDVYFAFSSENPSN
jgi:hypothetical protein